jgi:type I restriction enzyme S subunit
MRTLDKSRKSPNQANPDSDSLSSKSSNQANPDAYTRTPKLRFKGFDDEVQISKLNDLALKIMVGIASAATHAYATDGVPMLRNQNIKEGGLDDSDILYINKEYEKSHKNKRLKKGDILTVRTGYPGLSCLVPENHEGSQCFTSLIIRPDPCKIFSPWLVQYINSPKGKKRMLIFEAGGAQKNINVGSLENLPVPIISLHEQQKIASFLSAVDEKIQQLTRKKEALERYKKGVMQQLFSGKLRFKDENGKAFPKWEEKTLFDISENVSYGMNAPAKEFDGIHKYIRITDIDVESGKFNPNPITSPDAQIDEKFRLKEDDIVFARTGASVGKSYLYNSNDGQLYFAGFLIKFSIVNANSFFVYLLTLREEYYKWVHIYSMRSGQPGLNAEEYKALRFKLPSLPEQQRIASYISGIDTKLERISSQINETRMFKKGLLQQMFA